MVLPHRHGMIVMGNVGIGTTSPSTLLSVAGNSYFSGSLNVGDAATTRNNLGLAYASSANIANNLNVATWGDSITYGNGAAYAYPNVLATFANVNVYNGGVNGNTSAQIATRMLAAPSEYSWSMILWAGRNDIHGTIGTDEPLINTAVASMVAAATSTGNTNYIILSILNGDSSCGTLPWEGATTTNYAEITTINNDLKNTYGANHYLDVREYLVQSGLSVAGIATSSQDAIDAAADVPPVDLRADCVHPNAAGYSIVAQYVARNIGLLQNYLPSLVTTSNLHSVFGQNLNVTGSINVSQFFEQNGVIALYASSTNTSAAIEASGAAAWMNATSSSFLSLAIGQYALSTTPTNASAINNIAVGYATLTNNTTGGYNTALGGYALGYNTTGRSNVAVGPSALGANTTGTYNLGIGPSALGANTTGGTNTALGATSLGANTTGSNNVGLGSGALGYTVTTSNNVAVGGYALLYDYTGGNNVGIGPGAFQWNSGASNNVGIGYQVGYGALTHTYSNQGGVLLGYKSGYNNATSSDYNTLVGYQAGFDITTGNDNIVIGSNVNTGGNHLTTGANNILIGYNPIAPAGAAANNQLNIGNILFGTGLTATSSGTSIPGTLSGNIGIGTTSPSARLTVWGPDAASSTLSFNVVNSASTTLFAVFDGGNAQLSGTLTQSSDRRLKTNIQTLDASTSLAAINSLTPVVYDWLDPEKGGIRQYGFIAQQVQQVFPELVSTTSATALTPDGTLGLNYLGLIAPLVEAVQTLSSELTSLEATVAGFANSFTTKQLCVEKSDGSPVCINGDQLSNILSGTPSVQISAPTPPIISGTTAPPSINIQGSNPATINVGDTYTDLGAIVTDNQGHDLGYKTFLNGALVSNIVVDTSEVATDTIDYVATDTWGNTATNTRTVIVDASPNTATTSPSNAGVIATSTPTAQ